MLKSVALPSLCTQVEHTGMDLYFSEDATFEIIGKGKGPLYLSGDIVTEEDEEAMNMLRVREKAVYIIYPV